jgi:hypothetical protein
MRAPFQLAVEHAWESQIIGKDRLATDLRHGIDFDIGFADDA